MKKISLLMIAPYIFCSAVWAQVTQVASDSIVLERIRTETRPHTIYAKENLQAEGMTITTAAEEMIEFDYPCWVYYIHYDDQTDETLATRHYFLIKESSGNLLEVNTKNDVSPPDLTEWRIILKENIMDSLKGEWSWIRWVGGVQGADEDNQFKSIIKILSQNADSSINYEVWVKDTLFFQGSFHFLEYTWNLCSRFRTINIKLPHFQLPTETGEILWPMELFDYQPEGEESYSNLVFSNCAIDGVYYFYKKIK